MSLAEAPARWSRPAAPHAIAAKPPAFRGATGRLVLAELRLVFGRRRNQVLLAGLGVIPLLIGIALRLTSGSDGGGGPAFLSRVTGNGLFLVFTALVVATPFFLPLVVGVISGDAIAGEAGAGTLRYLLTVPVSRARVLLAKGLGALSFAAAAVGAVAVVGLITGLALFPVGRVTLLSGGTVAYADGLLRALGVVAYVVVTLAGLVAVGLFISTLTEVPVAAMAATVAFSVVSSVLDALPQLSAIHPLLLTHHALDFGDLLRGQVDLLHLGSGLVTPLVYAGLFSTLAWARFSNADVTA